MKITQREKEIILLVANELTTKEIASQLYISDHTVITHRKNLMEKLDVRNAAGLVRKGFESGLLTIAFTFFTIISIFCPARSQELTVGFEIDIEQTAVFGDSLGANSPTQMVWYPSKTTLVAGRGSGDQWDTDNVGNASVIFGVSNFSRGAFSASWGLDNRIESDYSTVWGEENQVLSNFSNHSTAWGYQNKISKAACTAWGDRNIINGPYGTAWGRLNRAGGYASTALGVGNIAKGYAGMVIGLYNDTIQGMADQSAFFDSTPLFVVGNGKGIGDEPRSNALSVYGSGFVKIGSGASMSDLHIKQSETEVDGGSGGIRLEHANEEDYWQIYNSGTFLSFGKDGERKAYIGSNGSYVDDENFLPEVHPLTKSLTKNRDSILKIRIGTSSYSKSKETIQLDASKFLKHFPDMIVYDENGEPFGIDYRQLNLTAIAALQDEIITNDQQQKEINFLKQQLKELIENLNN